MSDVISPSSSSTTSTSNTNNNINSPVNLKGSRPLAMSTTQIGISSSEGHSGTPTSSAGTKNENNNNNNSSNPLSLSNGANNSGNDNNNSRPQPLTSFLSMTSQQSNHNHEHHQNHFRVASSSAEHDFPSALNHRHQLHQQDSLFVSNSTVIFDEGSASRQESHNHHHQLHAEQEQEKTKINLQSSIPKPLMAFAMSPRLLDVNSLKHDDDADHEIVVADGSDRTRNSSDKSSPQKSEESPTKAGGGNTTTTRTTNNSTSSTSKANTSTPSKYYHHSQDNNNATQNSHEQQHQQQSQAQQQPRQENPRRGSLTTLGCVNNSNTSNRPFLNVEPPSNATSVRTSLSLNTAMLSRSRGHLRTHSGATDDDDGDDDEQYDNDDDGNENHQHQQYYYANVHGRDDEDGNRNLNYHDYDDNDESPEGERSGFEHHQHQHHEMMLNARRMTKQGDDYENMNNNNIYQDGAQRDDEYNGNNNENFFDAPTPSVCRSKQKKSKAERIREMMALDLSLNPEDEFVQDKEVEANKIMSSNNENDSVLDNNSNQESQRQFPQYSPSPPRSASNRGIECGSGSAVQQQQPQQQNGDVSSLLRLKSITPMSELENTLNNNNNNNSNFNNTTNTTTTTSESAPQSTSWVTAHQKKLNMMLQEQQQQQQPQSLQKSYSKSPETNNNNIIMSGPPPLAPKRKQRSNTKPPNHAEFKGWEIVSKSMVEQVDEIMMARQMSRNSRGSNGNNNSNHNYYFSSNDDDEFQGRSRTSSLGCNNNINFNVNDSKLLRNFSNGKNNNNNNNFESDLDSKQDLSGKLPEQHQIDQQDELLLLQDDNLGNSGFHQSSNKQQQQQQHNQRHATVLLKLDCDDDNQGGYDEDDVLQRSTTSAPNMKRTRTNSLGRPGSSLSVTPPNDSPPAVDLQDCQGENTNSGSSYRSSLNNNNNNAIIAKKTAASSSSSSKEEIRIMSYNILAQRYVTTDKYREYCSTTSLEQGYRVKNVVRQIAGAKPHILLMQEVATSLAEEGSQLRELLKEQGLDEMIHVTTTLPDGRDRVAAELERQKEMHQESLQTKPQCVGEDDDGTPTKSSATKGNVGLIEGVSISWDPKRFSLVDKDVVKFNVLVNQMACFSPDEKHVLKKASHNVANLVALKDLGSCSCNRKNENNNNNGDDDENEEDRILNCSTRTDKKNQSSTEENSHNNNQNNNNNNTQIFEPLDADDDNNKKKNENASEEPINIIIVACVHIYYDHSRRECQLWHLIKLTEAIEEFKSKILQKYKNAKVHVILGGDFNCDWNKYPIHFLESGKAVLPASAFGDDHTLMHHYMSKGGNIFGLNYENEKHGGSSDVEKACSSPLVNTLPTGGMFQSASLGGGTTMYSSEAVSTGATPTPPSTFITSAKSSSNNHPISLFPENNNINTYGSNNYLDNYFPNNATMISVPPTPAKRGSGPGGRRLSNMSGKNGNGTIQAPNVLLESCQASHSLNLVSAYKDYCVKNPTHVSAHDVQTSFAGVIDLIFFQPSGFRMTKIGRIMSRTYAVPNDRDPSDHCPVAVTLEPLY